MAKYSRSQQAQITKRVRLRGTKEFTLKDKKCLVCGHPFSGHICLHTVEENQEALNQFKDES